jgi:RNA polymerase sigma-70 factor (ECF subfamily)
MLTLAEGTGMSGRTGAEGAPESSQSMDSKPASLSSLEDLIAAVGAGSSAALKRLYELESRRLYGVALRIAGRPELAADALQEAFIQIWQKARSYSTERGSAAAWLTGIVRYRAIDLVRKLGREILSGDSSLGDSAEAPDIEEQIDRALAEDALRRCVGQLEANQRRCVGLAFVEGLSHAEIAARLNQPLGSVKSWIRRGLIWLRSCLGNDPAR